MKITYVGPFDGVEIDVNGAMRVVANGETIDLPVAIAGRPPSKEYLDLCADLVTHHADHARRSEIVAALASADVGEGLLAQHENWTAAEAKKEPKS